MNVLNKKVKPKAEAEKEWANPVDPESPGDERDEEKLLRQLKEAKRRKDNLTDGSEETGHTN